MIRFNYESDFRIPNESVQEEWIKNCIQNYGYKIGDLNYIFCEDTYLLRLNQEFLKHDTLTDIISFDYTSGKLIGGDIFISVERVQENAKDLRTPFMDELSRVMIHGVLHYMGYKDKTKAEKTEMRLQEERCMSLNK